MQTILNNQLRVGRFTSSEIYRLCDTPAKLNEYVAEKQMERRLGRSLSDETNARALNWGKLLERRVFDLLGIEYTLCSDQTIQHPEINGWSGSPDAIKHEPEHLRVSVAEVKCPVTLKSFCQMVDCFYSGGMEAMKTIRRKHKDGEKYYWQIVSNAVLTDATHGELIVYVPYKRELEEIRMLVQNIEGAEIGRYYFVMNSQDEELPHLIEGNHYNNLNILRFQIPQIDKDYLRDRVMKAEKLLLTAE